MMTAAVGCGSGGVDEPAAVVGSGDSRSSIGSSSESPSMWKELADAVNWRLEGRTCFDQISFRAA